MACAAVISLANVLRSAAFYCAIMQFYKDVCFPLVHGSGFYSLVFVLFIQFLFIVCVYLFPVGFSPFCIFYFLNLPFA